MTVTQFLGLMVVVLIIPLGMVSAALTIKAKELEKRLKQSVSLNRKLAQTILVERARSTAERSEAQSFCAENSLEVILSKVYTSRSTTAKPEVVLKLNGGWIGPKKER